MSDAVWLGVIGIAYMAVKEWFDQRREMRKADREAAAAKVIAEQVERVRLEAVKAATLVAKVAVKQEETAVATADKLDAIVQATNGSHNNTSGTK